MKRLNAIEKSHAAIADFTAQTVVGDADAGGTLAIQDHGGYFM